GLALRVQAFRADFAELATERAFRTLLQERPVAVRSTRLLEELWTEPHEPRSEILRGFGAGHVVLGEDPDERSRPEPKCFATEGVRQAPGQHEVQLELACRRRRRTACEIRCRVLPDASCRLGFQEG